MINRLLNIVYVKILLFIIATSCLFSCSDSNVVDVQENDLPDGVTGFTNINYEFLSIAPYHTQTSMLTGYQNKLYRIGSRVPVQVLDLATFSWSFIPLPDSSFWRWDGAAVTIKDSIYIIGTYAESTDILKLSPTTNSFQHTNVELPSYFHYPAYCTFNDKIIFFSLRTENVYEYNPENNKLSIKSSNPFYNVSDVNLTLSSGKYQNYFYIFGGYHDLPENRFYRMNLENYQWEKLYYPSILERKNANGSVFNNSLILIADTATTYEYSFQKNEWYIDTTRVPIYTRFSNGYLDRGEMSFFEDDSCLYVTDIVSNKVWRITK